MCFINSNTCVSPIASSKCALCSIVCNFDVCYNSTKHDPILCSFLKHCVLYSYEVSKIQSAFQPEFSKMAKGIQWGKKKNAAEDFSLASFRLL